jgi:tRNA modification GTPase
MMNLGNTIAAISTAPGTGAIAVVRMSGPEAFSIAKKHFRRPANSSSGEETWPKSQFATHGFWINPETQIRLDEVVVTPFQAPHTYTGEDLVEISCHGGPVVTAEILSSLLRSGARLARPGEFTQRAFLAGKIDLTQAEAVLDIIQAKTTRQSRRALSALSGILGERIHNVRTELLAVLTRIIAGLDFPEEIGDAPEPEVAIVVRKNLSALQELASTANTGRYLRDGLKLAIIGRPNAGKSSLLNQLLKFERAIVTDIPGTTRDSLEEMLDINGIPVVLIDTAGIRPTEDTVERIGIERTKKASSTCDIALFVLDSVEGWGAPEDEIMTMLKEKPFIAIINKIDLLSKHQKTDLCSRSDNCFAQVMLSAKSGANVDQLTATVESFVFKDQSMREGPSLNARQSELCLKAAEALQLALTTLASGYPQDCLSTDLKTAVDALSEISGESVSEEVIAQVFASFCIGK